MSVALLLSLYACGLELRDVVGPLAMIEQSIDKLAFEDERTGWWFAVHAGIVGEFQPLRDKGIELHPKDGPMDEQVAGRLVEISHRLWEMA